MEVRDDEEIVDGQNIQSTNESGCPSVSSDERTTGKLGSVFNPVSTLSHDLPGLNCSRECSHSFN